MKNKKCRRYGKTKYKSEADANKGKMWIWSHDPSADLMDLHTYKCEFCGFWHIGHYSKITTK